MKIGRAAVAVLLAAGAIVLPAQGASALRYDGTDPDATGCGNSAYTPGSGGSFYKVVKGDHLVVGYLELRFSSSCMTAWARVRSGQFECDYDINEYQNYYAGCHRATIYRSGSRVSYDCQIKPTRDRYGRIVYSDKCWTPQVYDGSGYKAWASASMQPNYPGEMTGTSTDLY
ncbi:MAG: DUF2690 domain-containing protein [Actinomycetales bacterium]|nr:DUF2690 domain-containing protein [Actinomycetales bacterium]